MADANPLKTTALFLSLIALVIVLSMISGKLWGGKPETLPKPAELTVDGKMSLPDRIDKIFRQKKNPAAGRPF